jgi:hypothetical protein
VHDVAGGAELVRELEDAARQPMNVVEEQYLGHLASSPRSSRSPATDLQLRIDRRY